MKPEAAMIEMGKYKTAERLSMLVRLISVVMVLAAVFLPPGGHAQVVRSSYSGTSGQNLPFWLTHEAGLFKKQGLTAELILISGGSTNIQALLANELQFVNLGASAPIQAAVQGADIVVIATSYNLMPYGLITNKAVYSPADLKGKRIAISRLGGIEEVAIRLAMEKLGLGPKDVTFVQTGPDSLRIAAVQSGAAAATALAPPALFAATALGLNILADLGSLGIKYPASVVAARRAYLAQERPTAKKFLMAFIEGLHLYKQKKSYAVQVLQKFTKQSDPKILSQSYDYFAKNTPMVPLTDPAAIQDALPGEKMGGRNLKEFYDNSLVQELVNEGFMERMSKEVK